MRILLTSGIYPPDIGGPATFIPELAESLLKRNQHVTVIALKPQNYQKIPTSYFLKLIRRSNFRIERILKTSIKIFLLLRRADSIFSNGLFLESAIPLRILRKPGQAKVVGDPLWERERNRGKTSLNLAEFQTSRLTMSNLVLRKAYVFALNSYSTIICPSIELTGIVRGWGVKREILYIPNGVVLQVPSDQKREFDLIYVGRLVKWKNVSLIIRTANRLGLRLCIIGDGPEGNRLKAQAKKLGVNCVFTGELEKSEVYYYLRKSSIFILISQYEGLSYALLEAMSIGIPVLVSNAEGNLGIIEDGINGKIVPLDKLNALDSYVQDMLNDPLKLSKLAMGAHETIKKHYQSHARIMEVESVILGTE
jgi:glycosyltransferase involved in cell wall biosynthesis